MVWENFLWARENRRIKALADELWEAGCVWPRMEHKDIEVAYIASHCADPAPELQDGKLRVEHPSMHRAELLDRIADHWVGRLRNEAIDAFELDWPIVGRWAGIDHLPFWMELASVVEDYAHESTGQPFAWLMVLRAAEAVGSLAPFEACPTKALSSYVLYKKQTIGCPGLEMMHPRVGLWFKRKGFLDDQQLRSMVSSASLGQQVARTHNSASFGGSYGAAPLGEAFVVQWFELLLRDYALDQEQKIRVAMHGMVRFPNGVWNEKVLPCCEKYLEGIDLDVVSAICGVIPDRLEGSVLHRTLAAASGDISKEYKALAFEQEVDGSALHHGVLASVHLLEPTERFELYALGKMVQDADLGNRQDGPSLPLPVLE